MPSEGLNRRAPTPLRRPAVQPAPPARGVGAARTGPSPADLQLRLGNRGTQAFLEQLAPARAGTAAPRENNAPPIALAPAAAGPTETRHVPQRCPRRRRWRRSFLLRRGTFGRRQFRSRRPAAARTDAAEQAPTEAAPSATEGPARASNRCCWRCRAPHRRRRSRARRRTRRYGRDRRARGCACGACGDCRRRGGPG